MARGALDGEASANVLDAHRSLGAVATAFKPITAQPKLTGGDGLEVGYLQICMGSIDQELWLDPWGAIH